MLGEEEGLWLVTSIFRCGVRGWGTFSGKRISGLMTQCLPAVSEPTSDAYIVDKV